MRINNKIKQALWQNWWKPNKTERKITNKKIELFEEQNQIDKNTFIWKKKKTKTEFNIWDKVVLTLFDILKPKICFFDNRNNKPPLSFLYLVFEITDKQYTKTKTPKYIWKFIKVFSYDYSNIYQNKIKEEDIKQTDEWIKNTLSWEIVFKNIQKKATKEFNLEK